MEGAAIGGFLLDRLGRRGTIAFACIPAIAGFLMISFANAVMVAQSGRVLTGFSVGLVRPLHVCVFFGGGGGGIVCGF